MHTQATLAATPATLDAPIEEGERLAIVDMLRGLALFGILLVNMAAFKLPTGMGRLPRAEQGLLDRLVTQGITLLAEGKFYSLFAMLFGFGFAIHLLRAQQRGRPALGRFARRLLILLLIGLGHALLIWHGDILVSYALIGLLLLLFRNARLRTLLIWSALLLLGAALLTAAIIGVTELARIIPGTAAVLRATEAQLLAQAAEEHRSYATGSYPAIVAYRARQVLVGLSGLLFSAPTILALFLLGLYVGKRGILHAPAAHTALLRRVQRWCLPLGLALSLAVVLLQTRIGPVSAVSLQLLNLALAGPILALGYGATFVLLAHRPAWQHRLRLLAPAGRMALTNYLLQSLICTTIFYGYGLGMFGRVSASGGLLLTLVIYSGQVIFSHWWLQRFRFGPLEWLWRSLTYGRVQPLRRAIAAPRQPAAS
ncbi:DUF418 domain-containing protein [Kallotenue papyrolyticum]|uniref:DUF418 domain-containing protein n=1 Tax=Kallotenue papyrolyticum TaxID=1325125 RepID=UPI0004785632|nr:DUF418 domain-containing protein [Kallotenue papyrolyticum]